MAFPLVTAGALLGTRGRAEEGRECYDRGPVAEFTLRSVRYQAQTLNEVRSDNVSGSGGLGSVGKRARPSQVGGGWRQRDCEDVAGAHDLEATC